ncbi:MAG: hypothetical protein JAY74_28985 [Candidatus Thiodiazotropha taylori]|nr:hypothetical protein [Candidatus Thiodiazotropha taylori]
MKSRNPRISEDYQEFLLLACPPRYLKILACLLALHLLSGCSTVPYEKGAIWCNEPLEFNSDAPFDKTHLDVARRGYIYALAGAYVLQNNKDEDKDHWFNLPSRLTENHRPRRDKSGFEIGIFELRDKPKDDEPYEIIIAYTGSNDTADWVFTNLLFSKRQYDLARQYLLETVKKYPGKRIVVTGYSLGGALAGHITKDGRTSEYVSEAWLFNPSPKLYANDSYNSRLWIGALRGEALQFIRTRPFEILWPGINRIGAPWQQNAQDYYLISAFPIYGHYRWALARNILFVADYAHLQNPIGPINPKFVNEPREILEDSRFKACEKEKEWIKHVIKSQISEQEKVTAEIKEKEKSSK